MLSIAILSVSILVGIILIALLFKAGYVKAPPDMAYIISGAHIKPRILIGKAGFKIPFFERLDKLYLGAIQIDVKTKSPVPTAEFINIRVDSTVSVRINPSMDSIEVAAQNFLNVSRDVIAEKLNDLLEGNIREIVGQMKLTEMVSDRKAFSERVQQNVVPDLNKFGLELVSFNVQNFIDENHVIEDLGIDNVAQISKNAAIAKSNAEREIAIAKAENDKSANDARIKADEEIAIRNNELVMRKAELKRTQDTAIARAEAAQSIEAEKQRQSKDVAAAEADIARQEKEIQLSEKKVAVKERALEAEIKKTAEAKKYAAQQAADADLYSVQKASEAELYERERQAEAIRIEAEKQAEAAERNAQAERVAVEQEAEAKKAMAEAVKAQGEAEAAAIRAKGEAEAAAIKAKAEAEAEGLMKKAEAMKNYGEAAKQDMQLQALKVYFEQLPQIAEAIGKGYQSVDKIYMYGGESSQLANGMMTNISQVAEGLSETLGIDIKAMASAVLGAKIGSDN